MEKRIPNPDRINTACPTAFSTAVTIARAIHPHGQANLSEYQPTQFQGSRCYLSDDCLSGFCIRPDGELVNVFSLAPGRGKRLVQLAVELGATKLDCFDGHLSGLYGSCGFKVVRREPNWDPAGPDVVFMET